MGDVPMMILSFLLVFVMGGVVGSALVDMSATDQKIAGICEYLDAKRVDTLCVKGTSIVYEGKK